jgi:hypothetical protein
MHKTKKVALALLVSAGLIGSTAVLAAGRLKPAGVAVAVARSGLTVSPDRAWSKGARPGRLSESWTLDGLSINELTFYGGIADNTTLFREVSKSERPLPRFSKTMLMPDIVQLFESSYRVALTTPLFTVDSVEPAPFAGTDGFRFTYSFAVADEVKRKGEARGAIIGGKLYMVTYEAPRIHYYDRDYASFVKIAESARIVVVKK